MMEAIALILVAGVVVAGVVAVVGGLNFAKELDKKNAERPVIVKPKTGSINVNYDSEAENLRTQFNWLIGGFLGIVLFQGIGVGSSIGAVLQEFGVSRTTSVFAVWLLALPLFFILRGMQILTNAILLDKYKDKN